MQNDRGTIAEVCFVMNLFVKLNCIGQLQLSLEFKKVRNKSFKDEIEGQFSGIEVTMVPSSKTDNRTLTS